MIWSVHVQYVTGASPFMPTSTSSRRSRDQKYFDNSASKETKLGWRSNQDDDSKQPEKRDMGWAKIKISWIWERWLILFKTKCGWVNCYIKSGSIFHPCIPSSLDIIYTGQYLHVMGELLHYLKGTVKLLGCDVAHTDAFSNICDQRDSLFPVPVLNSIFATLPGKLRLEIFWVRWES